MSARSLGFLLALFSSLAVDATGGIYGIGDFGELYSINASTGTALFLGDTVPGNTTMRGMDSGPNPALLYAVDNNSRLMIIDPETAVGTWVGPYPGITSISSLAYRTADGCFYAAQSGVTPANLYRITPSTGAASLVGAIDYNGGGFGYTSGLAYDQLTDTLYATSSTGASSLYELDPITAAATLIGPTGFGYVNGLTYWAEENRLFGVSEPYGTSQLLSISPVTGAGTAIGPTGVGIFGLGTATAVPEPASAILIAAGCLGVLRRRRGR